MTFGRNASGTVWIVGSTPGAAIPARMSATCFVYSTRESDVQSGS